MILLIVGLQHHHTLIAAESFFNVLDAGRQFLLPVARRLLHRIGAAVKREHQEIHHKLSTMMQMPGSWITR